MSLTKVTYSMIEGDSVALTDFGAVGDGIADDTNAIKAAIKYLQNDQEIDPTKTYTTAELNAIESAVYVATNRPKKLILNGIFRHTEPLVIIGGFEISTANTRGAYVGAGEKYGFIYDGATGDKIAIQTALFEASGANWVLTKTLTQIRALAADTDTILSKLKRISKNIIWSFSQGVKNDTYVGCLFDATRSYIHDSTFGRLGQNADIAFICINTWETKYERIHMYGRRQSVVGIRTNSSSVMRDIYATTTSAALTATREYMAPASSSYSNFATQIIGSYFKDCGIALDSYVSEHVGPTNHIVCDYKSNMTIQNMYQETQAPAHNNVTGVSCYNDSQVNVLGGFSDKSNIPGFAFYFEDCDSGRPSTISSSFPLSGGYVIKTVNSTAPVSIEYLGAGGTDNWGRDLTDTTGTTDLSLIQLKRPPATFVTVNPALTVIRATEAPTFATAILLANMLNVGEIRLGANVTLSANVDLDVYYDQTLRIDLSGYTLELNNYQFTITDAGVSNITNLYIDGTGTIKGNPSGGNYFMVNTSALRPCNISLYFVTLVDYFWIAGNFRDVVTRSNINLLQCTITNYLTPTLAGTPATGKSIDPITVYVDKTAAQCAGFTTPIANMPKGTFWTADDK